MNPFDVLILVILAWTLCRGIFRGFIREAASIVGVIAGFYLAYTYYGSVSLVLVNWVKNGPLLHPMSFALIFLVVFFCVNLAAVLIRHLMSLALLGWVDRILGGFFGWFKGVVLVIVVFVIATTFLPVNAPLIRDSVLMPRVAAAADVMVSLIPREVKQTYEQKMQTVRRLW